MVQISTTIKNYCLDSRFDGARSNGFTHNCSLLYFGHLVCRKTRLTRRSRTQCSSLGIIDDLEGIGKAANDRGIWYHVDGAYGLAALASPHTKPLFKGVELADSFIVDPHKWLFAPFDACALIYRNPETGRKAHTQHAGYLETLDKGEWNPSDYAIHLTRRVRGLPFWFSLATHGTKKYAESMDKTMQVAREAAALIREHANLELLMEPELSIVAFTRKGWTQADYQQWSNKLLNDQIGFVKIGRAHV